MDRRQVTIALRNARAKGATGKELYKIAFDAGYRKPNGKPLSESGARYRARFGKIQRVRKDKGKSRIMPRNTINTNDVERGLLIAVGCIVNAKQLDDATKVAHTQLLLQSITNN